MLVLASEGLRAAVKVAERTDQEIMAMLDTMGAYEMPTEVMVGPVNLAARPCFSYGSDTTGWRGTRERRTDLWIDCEPLVPGVGWPERVDPQGGDTTHAD